MANPKRQSQKAVRQATATQRNNVGSSEDGETPPPQRHGGWLQVQGLDMDPMLSYSWSRTTPIPAADAAVELDRLQGQCTAAQQRLRKQAFPKARRFITRLAGTGIDGPVSKTWNDPGVPPKKARVDIEVKEGRAFT